MPSTGARMQPCRSAACPERRCSPPVGGYFASGYFASGYFASGYFASGYFASGYFESPFDLRNSSIRWRI